MSWSRTSTSSVCNAGWLPKCPSPRNIPPSARSAIPRCARSAIGGASSGRCCSYGWAFATSEPGKMRPAGAWGVLRMAIASVVERVLDRAKADGIAAGQRTEPSLFNRAVWRDAIRVWGLQLVLVALISYFGRVFVLDANGVGVHLTWGAMFQPWVSWDAAIYGHIAQAGYDRFWETRFFPLLPALEHLFVPLTGGTPARAGVVISNLAAL